jgi:hypothetical protein
MESACLDAGIKILNYGPEKNYIIRPAQEMAIQGHPETEDLENVENDST